MRVITEMTRNFATFGLLLLQPTSTYQLKHGSNIIHNY